MKKCKECGKRYAISEIYCPQCGSLAAKDPAKALSDRLQKPIRFGNSNITLLAILWIVVINLTIVCCVVNAIHFSAAPVLWCQYAVVAMLAAMLVLRSVAAQKKRPLRVTRRAVYLAVLAFLIQLFAIDAAGKMLLFGLVMPSLLAALSITAFVLYLVRKCSAISFFATTFLNTVVALVTAIVLGANGLLENPAHRVVSYVMLAVSMLLLLNSFILWTISKPAKATTGG